MSEGFYNSKLNGHTFESWKHLNQQETLVGTTGPCHHLTHRAMSENELENFHQCFQFYILRFSSAYKKIQKCNETSSFLCCKMLKKKKQLICHSSCLCPTNLSQQYSRHFTSRLTSALHMMPAKHFLLFMDIQCLPIQIRGGGGETFTVGSRWKEWFIIRFFFFMISKLYTLRLSCLNVDVVS